MCASDQSEPSQISGFRPLGTACRAHGSDDSRLDGGALGGDRLEAIPDDLRPLVRYPVLPRVCHVGYASAEHINRASDPEEDLVCAADVHSVLRRPVVDRRAGVCAVGEPWLALDDGGLAGFFTVPAHCGLRDFRSDSRALQDVFFMRFNTRQVTRVV